MTDKIRLGIIGANSEAGWAAQTHLPAVVANDEFELTAVCTTKMNTAEESARVYGAPYAFDDYRRMLIEVAALTGSLRNLGWPIEHLPAAG